MQGAKLPMPLASHAFWVLYQDSISCQLYLKQGDVYSTILSQCDAWIYSTVFRQSLQHSVRVRAKQASNIVAWPCIRVHAGKDTLSTYMTLCAAQVICKFVPVLGTGHACKLPQTILTVAYLFDGIFAGHATPLTDT